MYPYFYPGFYQPVKKDIYRNAEDLSDERSMGNMTPVTQPQQAAQQQQVTQQQQVQPQPGTQPSPGPAQLPPVPGTTAGAPVESVPPAPVTMQTSPAEFAQEPGPPVTTDINFTQGFLRTQIGKRVRIEFLIGTDSTTDRIGTLLEVGISYVLIRLAESDDILMGDLYAIKFVTIYE